MSSQNLKFLLLGMLGGAVLMAVLIVLFEPLVVVLFGWPVIILSVLVLVTGTLFKRAVWVLAGAILTLPFALYMGATPRFRLVGLFLPLLLLAAAYAVQRERRWLAWLLLLPHVAFAAWLAWSVYNQG